MNFDLRLFVIVFGFVFVVGGGCRRDEAKVTGSAAAPVSAELPDVATVVKKAMPSVVLIVNYHADGSVGFGSGVFVDRDSNVITNLHVVDKAQRLGALTYSPNRATYTPMDGGLGRFLFEHQREIVPARILRKNVAQDLAIVRVDADPKLSVPLPRATVAPAVGDTLLSLGHPQETVWSFTSGVMSALHEGFIQHDALINPGSSGGPLCNRRGEIVGINTAMVKQTRGAGFARPIAMAEPLIDKSKELPTIDTSTPEKAQTNCLRALELGVETRSDCTDVGSMWDPSSMTETMRRFGLFDKTAIYRAELPALLPLMLMATRKGSQVDEALPLIRNCNNESERWLCQDTHSVQGLPPIFDDTIKRLREQNAKLSSKDSTALRTYANQLVAAARAARPTVLERLHTVNGLKIDRVSDFPTVLSMGFRVEEAVTFATDRAWIRMTGRNRDGSDYKLSMLRVYRTVLLMDGGWRESPATAEDLKHLPPGWPPPLVDQAYATTTFLAAFAEAWLEATQSR